MPLCPTTSFLKHEDLLSSCSLVPSLLCFGEIFCILLWSHYVLRAIFLPRMRHTLFLRILICLQLLEAEILS